jgi:hypothetical protein
MVIAQATFAIIGAIALEQGGAIANQVARTRILGSRGLKYLVENKEIPLQLE